MKQNQGDGNERLSNKETKADAIDSDMGSQERRRVYCCTPALKRLRARGCQSEERQSHTARLNKASEEECRQREETVSADRMPIRHKLTKAV